MTPEPTTKPTWRLLTRGDTVQKGDECLDDNCETWHVVSPIFRGMPYNPGFFMPARRRVEADPIPSQGTAPTNPTERKS